MRGVLTLVFITAFVCSIPKVAQSRAGLILLGVSAVGNLLITFVATSLTPRPETLHGVVHALVALASFFCGALSALLLARALHHDRHVRPSQRLLMWWAILGLVWSLIVTGTVVVSAQIGVWGLLERISTGLFLAWILIVTLGMWHRTSQEATSMMRLSLSQNDR